MALEDPEALVASIAGALNASGIPCVLWGHCLFQVHGVPTVLGSIDFAIPDEALPSASQALIDITLSEDAPLTPCRDPTHCSKTAPDRPTPPPSFHVHLKDSSDVGVGLYLQRETLWFLPSFDVDGVRDSLLSPVATKLPAQYILATDQTVLPPSRPGRSSGFFKPSATSAPVVVVRSHVLLEALMRIYARDMGTTVGSFALTMVAYIELYVDDDGFLDTSQLPDDVRELYEQHRSRTMPRRQWMKVVKTTLGTGPEKICEK